jgi:YNFM family putative membrane transporter
MFARSMQPDSPDESGRGRGTLALYLTFYYLGGTLGSVLPGLAWQAAGWPGVLACCVAETGVGLLANALLCGRR